MPCTSSETHSYLADTLDAQPDDTTRSGDSSDWLVKEEGPYGGMNNAVKVDESSGDSYLHFDHVGFSDCSLLYGELVCAVKLDVTKTGKFLLLLWFESTGFTGYAVQLDPDNETFKLVKSTGEGTTSDLDSESFSYSSSLWYVIRAQYASGTGALKAKIWELEDDEPESWFVEATDTTYAANQDPHVTLAHLGEMKAWCSWTASAASTSFGTPPEYPPDEIPEITGDGYIRWNFDDYGVPNTDWLFYGESGGAAAVDFPEAEVVGYAGGAAATSFEDAFALSGSGAWGGVGLVDFPEFFITDPIVGAGDVLVDASEIFDFCGYGGWIASVDFPEPGVSGHGDVVKSGDVESDFGVFTVEGESGACAGLDYEDFAVESSGKVGIIGAGEISFCPDLSASGVVGIHASTHTDLSFPPFSVTGQGRRATGEGLVPFPLFSILGSNLLSVIGNGETKIPEFSVSGSGEPVLSGQAATELDFDVEGSGGSSRFDWYILRYIDP